MSNRTKYKLKRAKLSFKKNVLAEGFSVRNTLAVLTLVSVFAICLFSVNVAKENIQNDLKNKAPKKVETAKAEVTTEEVTEEKTYSITLTESSMLDAGIIAEASNTKDADPDVEKKDVDTLSAALGENEFIVKADSLNIRASAGTDSEVVGHIYKGMTGKITESGDEWVKIESGDVTGYVKEEYISTEADDSIITTLGKVSADNVRVRTDSNSNSEIICMAAAGEVYPVIDGEESEWTKIMLPDGKSAFISSSYVDCEPGKANAVSNKVLADFTTKVTGYASANKTEDADKDKKETADKNKADSNKTENNNQTTTAANNNNQATTAAQPATQAPATEATTVAATEATTQAPTNASPSDFDLMCAVVFSESGYEPYEGQVAVANVILTRLRSGKWGNTIHDVLYAPNQFSCVYGARFNNALGGNVPATTSQAVQAALNGYNNVGNYMSFRPTWYLDPNSLSDCKVIGNHVFF